MKSAVFDRFFTKVDASGPCWEWTGHINAQGYGVLRVNRSESPRRAHRLSWELLVGEIPSGLVIDHLCRVRHCVNPDHLEPVENRVNLIRGAGFAGQNVHKRKCPKGHEYDRVATNGRGSRMRLCKTCLRGGRDLLPTLGPARVEDLRRLHAQGSGNFTELAARFNISRKSCSSIISGRQETALIVSAPPAEVRRWARENDLPIGDTGLIPRDIRDAYLAATAAGLW